MQFTANILEDGQRDHEDWGDWKASLKFLSITHFIHKNDLYITKAPIKEAFLGGEGSSKDSNNHKGIIVFAFKVRILFDFL